MAFIDILGFREIVRLRDRRLDRLTATVEMLESLDGIRGNRVEVTLFSDCVALSAPKEFACHIAYYAELVGKLYLQAGILPRGALVLGDLYHKDSIIVGPALIDAYDIERNVARYPRLVVDDLFAYVLLKAGGIPSKYVTMGTLRAS